MKDLGELGCDRRERLAEDVALDAADQPLRRAVENGNPAVGIDADDAGAGSRKHGFGESPPAVDEIAGANDVVMLRAQLLRHLVESLAQLGEIAFRPAHRHLNVEIAGGDHVGGADQAADRRDQPVGEIQPDPCGRQQNDQRNDREHQRECDLDAEPPLFEIGVFADALLGIAQLLHDTRIEQPSDVEIHVVVAVQLDDRCDIVAFRNKGHLRFRGAGLAEQLHRRQHEPLIHRNAGGLHDRTVGLEDERHGQIAAGGLRGEEFAKLIAILVEDRLRPAQVECHRHILAAHVGGMLGHVGVGYGQRLFDHGAGARREKPIEPAVERCRRDQSDQHGRHRGNDREQADDLNVETRSGASAPARLHRHPDFAPDDNEQQHAGDGIAEEQALDDGVDRDDRRQPRHDQKGRRRGK